MTSKKTLSLEHVELLKTCSKVKYDNLHTECNTIQVSPSPKLKCCHVHLDERTSTGSRGTTWASVIHPRAHNTIIQIL